MKKTVLILFLSIIFLQCGTINKKNDEGIGDKFQSSTAVTGEDIIQQGWSLYSYGIYYKIRAIEEVNNPEKSKYFTLAIKYFKEAAIYGESLDRIYFQLSDCYYYSNDYYKSLEYARKSISINKNTQKPYNRIFGVYIRLRNYKKAAEILEDYLKVDPGSVHVQFILAQHYYQKLTDMKKAESAFKKVIEVANRSPIEDYYKEQAYYHLGYIALRSGNKDVSILNFLKVVKININNIHSIYILAILYMEKYQLDQAKKYSGLYLRKFPDNIKMHSILGRVKYLQNLTGTLRHFRVVSQSKEIDNNLASGLYHEILQKDNKAEGFLRIAIRYRPKYISPHIALARIYLRKNDKKAAFNEFLTAGVLAYRNRLFDKARFCFTEAVRLNNKVPEVYFYLGRIFEEKNNIYLAIIQYKKVNELKPGVDIMLHIGYLYAIKKAYPRAFSFFDLASQMEPENSRPYFFKGLGSMWGENYQDAEVNIKKAISLNEKNERYYFYLAVVLEKQKKLEEAVESLEKAIKYNPKSSRAYNFLGYLYADYNIKIDKSLVLIKKALEIEPNNGAYLDSLGWVYYRKGKYELALKKLHEAEKELKKSKLEDPVVFDHIGDTYNKIGKVKNAIFYWKKSLKIEKNSKIEEKVKKYQGTIE